MGKFLKQPQPRTTGPRKAKKEQPAPTVINEPADLGGIENSLKDLAAYVRDYVHNAAIGENSLQVFTGEEGGGNYPVLLALERSDTMDRFLEATERMAAAFERIADTMSPRATSVPVAAVVPDVEDLGGRAV
jgi:hypothetical protein